MATIKLTASEQKQISEILKRRANEIAGFSDGYRRKDDHYGSVEMALTREVERLRNLASRLNPPKPEDDEECK